MKTPRFDIADYLDNEEIVAEYLNTVLADGHVLIQSKIYTQQVGI